MIDTETTGVQPGFRHRIAEVAVVHVDLDGTITNSWCSLVNPERDLGPQAIHGIKAADVRRAPLFDQLVGDLVELLTGRVVVAHNWPFDAMHLRAEFERLDIATPFYAGAGLCTMRTAGQILPWSRRSLIECCAAVGLPDRSWHTASADAEAAAELLGVFIEQASHLLQLSDLHLAAAAWDWPELPRALATPVQRTPVDYVAPHFLARLIDRIPRSGEPIIDAYMAMLDGALLDRQISESEADGLIDLAHEMGLHKTEVVEIHRSYLYELGRAAWADGILTAEERHDVKTVAALLGLDDQAVDEALSPEADASRADPAGARINVGGLALVAGDRVVLTGQMRRGRAEITAEARDAGLTMTTSVSRQTKVVVAADPDSLSGKAKNARLLGVPVVSEETFMRVLAELPRSNC
ncbi:exonuclease domain-containing protein [Pseudonocardia sp. RS010]|uniref:exonuclease domain-containing protein n=1 Tax=Pseudonocardia sp. RS010 TaxID=3385979 RepID=UPI0039A0409F